MPSADSAAALVLRKTVHAPGGVSLVLPSVVAEAGEDAAKVTLEFFTARIANPGTRKIYGRAVWKFCRWCELHSVRLHEVTAPTVAAYLEQRQASIALVTVKVEASALRHWLDFLTERGVLKHIPASAVRTPRLVIDEGRTPVLEPDEARKLFASLDDDNDLLALRDRAMFSLMLFAFLRVGAVVKMAVGDFEERGAEAWLSVREKGGKMRRLPCHHRAAEYLRAYITAAGLDPRGKEPLFQSAPRRTEKLSGRALLPAAVWEAVQRRCDHAGIVGDFSCHTFRATGITLHQAAGGRLEDAQALAGHADARTTKLYVRTHRKIQRAEVERVQL